MLFRFVLNLSKHSLVDDNVWFVIFEKARILLYSDISKANITNLGKYHRNDKMDKHACFILGELFLISGVLHLAKQ